MNRNLKSLALLSLTASLGYAAETATWNLDLNTVTYSLSTEGLTLGSSTSVHHSQFNASDVAAYEGVGSANQYTLTKVVLSLDGTILGTVTYKNTGSTVGTPKLLITGSSSLSFDGHQTDTEEFYQSKTYPNVAAGDETVKSVTVLGTGLVSTPEITTDLQSFIGNGSIATQVAMPADVFVSFTGTEGQINFSITGTANTSVTYYYDYNPIPEPTTMALLGFGCVALLSRRRFRG